MLAVTALTLSSVASVACGGDASPPASDQNDIAGTVADSAATQDIESQATALAGALQLGIDRPGATADEAATAAAKRSLFFRPVACISSVLDATAHKVTHTLNGCTGPWGLANVTGTLTVTYGESSGAADAGARVLELDVEGRGLKIRKGTADYSAHATWIAEGAARTMTVTATSAGTTAANKAFTRTASSTLTWAVGESCITLNGTAESTVAKRTTTTVVKDYERCKNACPEAGGTVTVTLVPKNVTVTVTFDGTNVASYTDGEGHSSVVPLACAE